MERGGDLDRRPNAVELLSVDLSWNFPSGRSKILGVIELFKFIFLLIPFDTRGRAVGKH